MMDMLSVAEQKKTVETLFMEENRKLVTGTDVPPYTQRVEGDGQEHIPERKLSSTSIGHRKKRYTPKYVPWEPVRGAVEPYSDVVKEAVKTTKNVKRASARQSVRSRLLAANPQDQELPIGRMPSSDKLHRYALSDSSRSGSRDSSLHDETLHRYVMSESSRSTSIDSSHPTTSAVYANIPLHTKSRSISPGSRHKHLSSASTKTPSSLVSAPPAYHSGSTPCHPGYHSGCLHKEQLDHRNEYLGNIGYPTPPPPACDDDDEEVYESNEKKQIKSLTDELHVQTEINAELKKLLVASVGDDFHHKLDCMLHTKSRISHQNTEYCSQISDLYEQIEKLSIQCDVWRSKYLASRVMVSELSAWKATLLRRNAQLQNCIQDMLEEHETIRKKQAEVYKALKQVRDAFDPLNTQRQSPYVTNSCTMLDLANTNEELAISIKSRLLGAIPQYQGNAKLETKSEETETTAEKQAQELLSSGVTLPDLSVTKGMIDRFHPETNFDMASFACCPSCSGDVKLM